MYLQTATEDNIRCLLCKEPSQNNDETMVDDIDQLFVEWKQTKHVPEKLKGLLI